MLKIKESEWQRFCDNAESLGFIKDNMRKCYNCFCDTTINIFISHLKQIIIFTNNIHTNNSLYDLPIYLYDLITQGYVEKVEKVEDVNNAI